MFSCSCSLARKSQVAHSLTQIMGMWSLAAKYPEGARHNESPRRVSSSPSSSASVGSCRCETPPRVSSSPRLSLPSQGARKAGTAALAIRQARSPASPRRAASSMSLTAPQGSGRKAWAVPLVLEASARQSTAYGDGLSMALAGGPDLRCPPHASITLATHPGLPHARRSCWQAARLHLSCRAVMLRVFRWWMWGCLHLSSQSQLLGQQQPLTRLNHWQTALCACGIRPL